MKEGEKTMTKKKTMTTEEVETIWNYSKYHIGDWVEMYTTDKTIMRRYERFANRYPDHCKLIKEDAYSMTFTVDPKCMGFNPKAPRKGPVLTAEQKQANSNRLAKLRMKKTDI